MRSGAIWAAILAASVRAAPAFPSLALKDNSADALQKLSDYFNLIAAKIQDSKNLASAPSCDLSKARMPAAGLPSPDEGLRVRHVAVGRGTQNYTCDTDHAESVPKPAGAVATLFNASCVAALYPDVLSRVPGMVVHFRLEEAENLGVTAMAQSGLHYFVDSSTPFFNLDTPNMAIGQVACAKNSSADAPAKAALGQLGEKAVPWLRLTTRPATTGGIKAVYRVDTAGGSPPATCRGMPAKFQVEYAAVYWFWESSSGK